MLSIASGSRARIETANSHRAPEWEAIESMAAMLRSTGVRARASCDAMKDASEPIDLLLSLSRDGSATLGAQIEDQVRRAVRRGTLKPGSRVPSMRDLARQLGVSRKVVADAYSQLAAEGYLTLRQGARPHVSRTVAGRAAAERRGRDPGPAGSIRLPPEHARRLHLPAGQLAALAAHGARDHDRRRPRVRRPARRRRVAHGARRLPRPRPRRRRHAGADRRHQRVLAGTRPRLPRARDGRRAPDRVRGPEPPRAALDRRPRRPHGGAGRRRRRRHPRRRARERRRRGAHAVARGSHRHRPRG